jgi:hypothetical protein
MTYASEQDPDPRNWGRCWNSGREDGRCRHRLTMAQHSCLGRVCPADDDEVSHADNF